MASVLLAHGAWSSAWAWKRMRPLMARSGHDFYAPSYTGLGERDHLAAPTNDLETHIQDVLGVIRAEELTDIVLIGHSYGGIVATGVADRARDVVRKLIYLDAFAPNDGESLFDLIPEAQRSRMRDSVATGDGWRIESIPPSPDTSSADREWINRHKRLQSIKCFEQRLRLSKPLDLPRFFIQCVRYAENGPFGQFAERANTENGWKYYALDASHSPNITAPDLLQNLRDDIIAAG
jgi:pimeloyl-ACP methyl ester carboxylesterase